MTTLHQIHEDPDRPLPADLTDREAVEERDLAAVGRLLAEGLGQLRQARSGYQGRLEVRLVARLPEATRPWWRRAVPPVSRRNGHVASPTRRRALLGLAAGAVGVLAAASLASPIGRPPEVSAAEIFEKAQSLAENPFLSDVKSFHLKAKSSGQLDPQATNTGERTIEQWFASSGRKRMETRFRAPDGSTVITGWVADGESHRFYSSPGADKYGMPHFIATPALSSSARPEKGGGQAGAAGQAGAKVAADVIWVAKAPAPGAAETKPTDVKVIAKDKAVMLINCPEPTRRGEATIAKRAAYIVEADMSACTAADGSKIDEKEFPKLGGRHVTWVDKETFLPLKMEDYSKEGKLRHSYEVTSIEYDAAIPDSIFKDIPPKGTEITEPPFPTRTRSNGGGLEGRAAEEEVGLAFGARIKSPERAAGPTP